MPVSHVKRQIGELNGLNCNKQRLGIFYLDRLDKENFLICSSPFAALQSLAFSFYKRGCGKSPVLPGAQISYNYY